MDCTEKYLGIGVPKSGWAFLGFYYQIRSRYTSLAPA